MTQPTPTDPATGHARVEMPAAELERLLAQRDSLAAALDSVCRQMYEKGHPGEPCLRSGWIRVSEVEQWRALLAEVKP